MLLHTSSRHSKINRVLVRSASLLRLIRRLCAHDSINSQEPEPVNVLRLSVAIADQDSCHIYRRPQWMEAPSRREAPPWICNQAPNSFLPVVADSADESQCLALQSSSEALLCPKSALKRLYQRLSTTTKEASSKSPTEQWLQMDNSRLNRPQSTGFIRTRLQVFRKL